MNELGGRYKNFIQNVTQPNAKSEMFVAIVDEIIGKESPHLSSLAKSGKFTEYIDNRSHAIITPIDSYGSNSSITAHFLNSHDIDMPVKGEAVLVMESKIGNIILDRVSLFAFGLNYDLADYLLQTSFDTEQLEMQFGDEYLTKVGKRPLEEVAPFFHKEGSNVKLGRNNQYVIFDHGARFEASTREKKYASDGSFIKIGFRRKGKQVDSADDSMIIFARQAPVESVMGEFPKEDIRPTLDEAPEEGIGIKSDQLMFIGKTFAGIYSKKDIVIKGLNVFIKANLFSVESETVNIVSDEINLGKEASSPVVKGDALTDFLKDLISEITKLQIVVAGTAGTVNPISSLRLQKMAVQYLNKSTSSLLSRVSKTK